MKHDVFWSGLEAGISACLSIVTSFMIARIVGPSELGVGTAVTALHVVLWVLVNGFIADALVQRATIDDRLLSSASWVSIFMGCLAFLLQTASGWALAVTFADARLIPMSLLLGAPLPLVGVAGVVQGLLVRERAYRSLALRTIIGQGLATAIGVAAALLGGGAWAVVLQQTIGSTIGALTLLLGRGWKPPSCFDYSDVASLLRIGVPLTASTLVAIARYRLFAILIGAAAGPAVLGHVHIAFRLVDTVRELTFTALWRLMLPALSALQHDRPAMLAQVDCWLRRSLFVVLPLCAILVFGLTHIVTPIMGAAWAQTGQAAIPLVILLAWYAWLFPSGVALIAVGQARFTLYANIASLILSATAVLLLRPTTPAGAVTIWTASQMLITPYALWINARALRVSLLRPLTGGLTLRATA